MKLATYRRPDGTAAIAAVDVKRGALLDLANAARASGLDTARFADMLALIDAGPRGLDSARALEARWRADAELPLAGTSLLAPVPEPRQLRDCLVFEEHLVNSFKQTAIRTGRPQQKVPEVWYRQPIYYKCNRFSVIGHEQDVIWPSFSEWMDYELELACVIGKTGKDIRPERAMEHVFGFTIFNDVTARDAQYAEMEGRLGPAKGKDFDTGNVFGPWIVTLDEIGNPHALNMDARINGERWGGGNSSDMHHKFPAILAHISRSETIRAGEIICSGTVGTGCANELGKRLSPGDLIELEIEKIGVLRNRIVKR